MLFTLTAGFDGSVWHIGLDAKWRQSESAGAALVVGIAVAVGIDVGAEVGFAVGLEGLRPPVALAVGVGVGVGVDVGRQFGG